MANQPHHKDPRFVKAARLVRRAANANPRAICWRCGRTLEQHEPHRNGKRPSWQAGHTIDGVLGPAWLKVTEPPPKQKAFLAAEASTCNLTHGAITGNRRRGTGYDWP